MIGLKEINVWQVPEDKAQKLDETEKHKKTQMIHKSDERALTCDQKMYIGIDMECGNTKEGCQNIVRLAIIWQLISEGQYSQFRRYVLRT